MRGSFNRRIDALDDVFRSIDAFVVREGLPEPIAFATKLAVEELFTNLVRHNTGGSDHIDVDLAIEDERLVVRLTDFDVEPFDESSIQPVDVHLPLEDRKVGGLGVHLVRNIFDELTYAYSDRTLCVTAAKNLET